MQSTKKERRPARPGSMGYQLLQVLKAVFQPSRSRHHAKQRGEADALIFGIETMRKYARVAFGLAKFLREHYPECRRPEEITPVMCEAFVESLIARELAGGTLGIHLALIRKLDQALRHLDRIHSDAPALLPTKKEGGRYGFRADTSTVAYMEEEALAILRRVKEQSSGKYHIESAQVIELMRATGLRISEAVYLRAAGIDLDSRRVSLFKNTSRTKGGKPRVTAPFDDEFTAFMAELKAAGEANAADYGCIFRDRGNLANHVRAEIRRACSRLGIKSLGSHAFRKLNAQGMYARLRGEGLSDEDARLEVARHLGHNRTRVTVESYVPAQRSMDG